MQCRVSVICILSVFIALSHAAPAGQQGDFGFTAGGSLNTTALVSTFNQKVQVLRQLCPQLFQVIDNVVQNITSQLFSVVGRVILRNGLGGGGSSGGSVESRVSVVLPTFPPDDDDYDDEDEQDSPNTTSGGLDVRVMDTRTSTTEESSNDVALSANEVGSEDAPFTAGEMLQSRVGENVDSNQMFDLLDEDCGGASEPANHENAIGTTSTENTFDIDVINRNSFDVRDGFDSENLVDSTTANSEDNSIPSINEIESDSVITLEKGVVEVEYSDDGFSKENSEASTANNLDGEFSKENSGETTTTEGSISFDIKVVQNGTIVNTIPFIGENSIKESESVNFKRSPASDSGRSRRVIREAETDQEAAASGGNGPDPADLADVEVEDADRDKRYLPFGGEAHVSAGGGSGNFLFDIIRRTADGAARAVGTVYRMVAGTESIGIGLSATSTATRVFDASAASQLIAGSGATEESDEKEHGVGAGGVAEIDVAKAADGYTEGIPGPITRLFVIANRGLANLVQDLILRLAQTSERIVNFKARLITALI